jgi:hypothetical protein
MGVRAAAAEVFGGADDEDLLSLVAAAFSAVGGTFLTERASEIALERVNQT